MATLDCTRDRAAAAEMLVTHVRSALWADDAAGYTEAIIGAIVDVVRRAADDPVPKESS